MTSLVKIKLVAYFSFSYAILHLLSVLGSLSVDGKWHEAADQVIKTLIWMYIGYSLLNNRIRIVYWFTVFFLGLIIFRYLAVVAIDLSIYLEPLALILLLCAIVSLIILAQKDVRALFSNN